MSSTSDVARAGDIELQEITDNASGSIKDLIKQLRESSEDLPMQKLLGLHKQLRSIWGSLKADVAKKGSDGNTPQKGKG